MEFNSKLSKQIKETAYLTAENTPRYRPILRYIYEQYETTNYMLYKEEIYDELKDKKGFESYTLETCEKDLDALVNWGNLIAIQDTNNVNTVEEFKNRKFRYQLSPYAVEIERLVIKLENLHTEGGSLEPMLIERIKDALINVERTSRKTENEVHGWWKNLDSDFKRLNQGYQDYIKTFYTVKMEEVAKSSQFIAYKNTLVKYLREFIKILQESSYQIEEKLKNLDANIEDIILKKLYLGEKNIIRIDKLDEELNKEEYIERNKAKWENIKKWFIGSDSRRSEVVKINEKTTEIIRKITRIANQIAESRGNVSSKKAEYKKICEMFAKTENIEDAHKLSSLVFGMTNTRHTKGNFVRETDSINSSLLQETSNEIEVKPRIRTYKEKSQRTIIQDKKAEKQEQIKEYMEKIKQEQEEIQKYVKDGKIDINELPVIKSTFRKTLLKWITKAGLTSSKLISTEDGKKIRLIYPENNKRCTLECEDGNLEMPAFILQFVE